METTYSDRKVPVFSEEHHLYVEYVIKKVPDQPNRVRLVCNLCSYGGNTNPLVTSSFTVEKGSNYALQIQKRAFQLFKRPLSKKMELSSLYQKLYAPPHPFRAFLDQHFENIALLNDWAVTTTDKYRKTLYNQLAPHLPVCPVSQMTTQQLDHAVDQLIAQRKEKGSTDYSESRLNQFYGILYAVMEYAADIFQMPNLMKNSKYNDPETTRKMTGVSLESLIEKRLRRKALEVHEQINTARQIQKSLAHGDALAIGIAILLWLPIRPSEACGLRYESICYFTRENWQHRCYFLIQAKVLYKNKFSRRLKTVNAYRAIPIPRELQMLLEEEKARLMTERNLSEKEIAPLPIISKNGVDPVKSEVLCDAAKKVLTASVGRNPDLLFLTIPMEDDEQGRAIPLEENRTAYQFRRNGASALLNIAGESMESAQATMGHEIPAYFRRRWMLYHEDALIERMKKMDQLILLPEGPDEEIRPDPRKHRRDLTGNGVIPDVPVLALDVQPYSKDDVVTVNLLVSVHEPEDPLELQVRSEETVTLDYTSFYSDVQTSDPSLNLQNDYLDLVFGAQEASQEAPAQVHTLSDEERSWLDEEDRVMEKLYETAEVSLEEAEDSDEISIDEEDGEDDDDF